VSKVEKIEEVDGVVKQEIKMEDGDGDGDGDDDEKLIKKEVKIENGEDESHGVKSKKRKVTTVKSEFTVKSAMKMEPGLNKSVLEEGSMLDRIKRRRRAK